MCACSTVPAHAGEHRGYEMRKNRVAGGVLLGALALASSAAGQVNTVCQTIGQQTYCNSTGLTSAPGYDQTIALRALTPSQMQQQAAEAQLATIRAQQAQAELAEYRQAQAQRNAYARALAEQQAQANAYAAKVVRCSDANEGREAFQACMAK